jgi:hypothetical protein
MGRHSENSRETLPEASKDTLMYEFEQETRGRRKQSKLRRRVRAGVAIATAVLAYNVASGLASDSPNSNTVAVESPADNNGSGSNTGGSNEKTPSASPSQNMDEINCDIHTPNAYVEANGFRVELELDNKGKAPATYVATEYNNGKFGDSFDTVSKDPAKDTTFTVPSTVVGQEVAIYAIAGDESELCGGIKIQGDADHTVDFVTDNTMPNPMPR